MTHRCTVRQTFIVCHNRVNEHESEEDYLFAMEKMKERKEEKKVTMR